MGRDSPNFLPPGGDSPTHSPDVPPPFLTSSWPQRPPLPLPTLPHSFPFSWRPGAPLFPPLFSQYLLHHPSLLASNKPLLSSILPHSLNLPQVSTPPTSPTSNPVTSPSSSPPSLPPLPPSPPQTSATDLSTNVPSILSLVTQQEN